MAEQKSSEAYYVSRPISVSEEEIRKYCAFTGDAQNLHLDPSKAKEGVYGRLVVPGLLLASYIPRTHFDMLREKEGISLSEHEIILKGLEAHFLVPIVPDEIIRYEWYLTSELEHRLGLEKNWQIILRSNGTPIAAQFNLSTIYARIPKKE